MSESRWVFVDAERRYWSTLRVAVRLECPSHAARKFSLASVDTTFINQLSRRDYHNPSMIGLAVPSCLLMAPMV